MLSTPLSADAFGSPRIAPSVKSLPISNKIAKSAKTVATRTSTVGWCYRGVKAALANVGVALTGPAAWMAKSQLLADLRFVIVPFRSLKTGDILVHGRSPAHPYGHIAVYLGNNQEASDHVQKLVIGYGYGDTVVFRASDKAFNEASSATVCTVPPAGTVSGGTVANQTTKTSAVTAQVKTAPTVPAIAHAKAAPAVPVIAHAKAAPAVPAIAQAKAAPAVPAIAQAKAAPAVPAIAHATQAPSLVATAHRSTSVIAAARSTSKRRATAMLAYAGSMHSRPVTSHGRLRRSSVMTAQGRVRRSGSVMAHGHNRSGIMVAQSSARSKSARAEALRHAVAVAQRGMRQRSRQQEALLHAVRVAHHATSRNRTEFASASL